MLFIDYFKQFFDSNTFNGIDTNQIHNILDLGTGSGILAIILAKFIKPTHFPKAKIYASDILSEAIEIAKENARKNSLEDDIEFIQSNLFDEFPPVFKNKFEIILFNPPYLPSEPFTKQKAKKKLDYSWEGGEKGIETFEKFLSQSKDFMSKSVITYIYFTFSSNSPLELIYSKIKDLGFQIKILKKVHIFFEDIILHRISKKYF